MSKATTAVATTLARDEKWLAERQNGLGGSDAKRIMEGDWLNLWREKTGRQEPEDLSRILQVQLGVWTEPFNIHWFQQETGLEVTTEDCEHLFDLERPFMRANLDGRIGQAIFEAKHVSAFAKDEEIVSRYYPQLQHCMAVSGATSAYLSVIFGNHKWAYFEVAADSEYQAELVAKEAEFWGYVERDEEPPQVDGQTVDISFDEMREVDLSLSNAWADGAADWLEYRTAAKKFAESEKTLKGLVEPDVKLAFGCGVQCKRAKNGSLRISEVK